MGGTDLAILDAVGLGQHLDDSCGAAGPMLRNLDQPKGASPNGAAHPEIQQTEPQA